MKNIRRKAFDIKALRLSPEEGFVLSRLDSPLSAKELVSLTGIEEGRVKEIVETLASQGVIDLDRDGPAPVPAAVASVQSSTPVAAPRKPEPEPEPETEPEPEVEAAAEPLQELEEVTGDDEEEPIVASPPDRGSSPDLEAESEETAEEQETRAQGEREYRKIYETLFHPMQRDERVAAAAEAQNPELFALCLDADPQVIHAVLTNPKSGLEHARMIATHHRTHVGLEMVGKRSEFLGDVGVQRKLLVNPQLPGTMLRRMLNPKLIMEVYKVGINREIPERSRVMTREILCKKFMLGGADERAALLIKTDGRCLILLVNCALDARTTQILTAKTTYTILFIQNLARWSATPPQLLTHLLKQPVVRQSMGLRKMLLKHPNVPMETKRNFS